LKQVSATIIFYEAPHRIDAMLADILSVFGNRDACVARELTKIHEEYVWGKISELPERVRAQGELVVIVGGGGEKESAAINIEGLSRKDLLKLLAEKTGIPKNQLYSALLK
jgi:16S rRNA (cytidine1402-2'-O)-methyltransferase